MTTQSPTQRAHTSPSIEEALAALDELPGEHAPTSPAPENQAEHAWESLNVAGFPGLEDVNGLRNARWGFVAGYLAAAQTIRSALTSAVQEAAAWREIEAWLAVDTERDFVFSPSCRQAGKWVSRLVDGAGAPRYGEPDSRLAAIVAAGEYCRAERERERSDERV